MWQHLQQAAFLPHALALSLPARGGAPCLCPQVSDNSPLAIHSKYWLLLGLGQGIGSLSHGHLFTPHKWQFGFKQNYFYNTFLT